MTSTEYYNALTRLFLVGLGCGVSLMAYREMVTRIMAAAQTRTRQWYLQSVTGRNFSGVHSNSIIGIGGASRRS